MLIELLRPAGPELARRWLAALLLAPEKDRPAIVAEVVRRMVALYAEPLGDQRETEKEPQTPGPVVRVVSPPVQRAGYTEVVEREYAPAPRKKTRRSGGQSRSA
ncbi:MAG: hypothetical protein D6693_01740 [Planctomycetota bacterium]|nr:MAG: hypothetical protein D6693_01740 [Planctomycetota bacterium]